MGDTYGINCGSYSVELTPAYSWITYESNEIKIDQSLLTDDDVNIYYITYRAYQDPAVDGYTSPYVDIVPNEAIYEFRVTVHTSLIYEVEVGPYQASNENF